MNLCRRLARVSGTRRSGGPQPDTYSSCTFGTSPQRKQGSHLIAERFAPSKTGQLSIPSLALRACIRWGYLRVYLSPRTDDSYLGCIQNRIVDPVHFGAEQQFHW